MRYTFAVAALLFLSSSSLFAAVAHADVPRPYGPPEPDDLRVHVTVDPKLEGRAEGRADLFVLGPVHPRPIVERKVVGWSMLGTGLALITLSVVTIVALADSAGGDGVELGVAISAPFAVSGLVLSAIGGGILASTATYRR